MGSAESGAHRAYSDVLVSNSLEARPVMTALATAARHMLSPPDHSSEAGAGQTLVSQCPVRDDRAAERPGVAHAAARVPGTGHEPAGPHGPRFTAYHALPDTATLAAKDGARGTGGGKVL